MEHSSIIVNQNWAPGIANFPTLKYDWGVAPMPLTATALHTHRISALGKLKTLP